MLDRDEDSVAVGIVELKILATRAIGSFELFGSHISAEAVRGVDDELTGIEGGIELRWQDPVILPAIAPSQTPRSGNVRGRGWRRRTRGARAGHHHETDRD